MKQTERRGLWRGKGGARREAGRGEERWGEKGKERRGAEKTSGEEEEEGKIWGKNIRKRTEKRKGRDGTEGQREVGKLTVTLFHWIIYQYWESNRAAEEEEEDGRIWERWRKRDTSVQTQEEEKMDEEGKNNLETFLKKIGVRACLLSLKCWSVTGRAY